MKKVRFLIAIYILILTLFPCNDMENCADELKAGVFLTANSNDFSNREVDFCSPFCICSCCAAHVQLNLSMNSSAVNPTHNTKVNTPYFERPLLDNAKTIWQPPKIS